MLLKRITWSRSTFRCTKNRVSWLTAALREAGAEGAGGQRLRRARGPAADSLAKFLPTMQW